MLHETRRWVFKLFFVIFNKNNILVKPSTFAVAATIFHRVIKNLAKADYDKFSISTGVIYLASKANEDPLRLKDIINVSQVTLKRETSLNELGNEAWIISMRDSIIQCELFLMRVLHFDSSVRLPHPVSRLCGKFDFVNRFLCSFYSITSTH